MFWWSVNAATLSICCVCGSLICSIIINDEAMRLCRYWLVANLFYGTGIINHVEWSFKIHQFCLFVFFFLLK